MSNVNDWAREQARDRYEIRYSVALGASAVRNAREQAFEKGIVHAFSALLSDEAMEAAARHYWALPNWERLTEFDRARQVVFMRAALQAAVDAVTKEARNE